MRQLGCVFLFAVAFAAPRFASAQRHNADDLPLLARLAADSPCPQTIPKAWLRVDSTYGQSPLCAVLAASAALLAASPDSVQRWIGANATCVEILSMSGYETTAGPENGKFALWGVNFMADTTRTAIVNINRLSGEMSVRPSTAPAAPWLRRQCRVGS